jgi:hypothetical protein
MNIENLSDWIWFGVVAVWLLMRILPRLFRGRSASTDPAPRRATSRPMAPQPRPVRTSGERISIPRIPSHEQDPEMRRRLQSAAPIDPS